MGCVLDANESMVAAQAGYLMHLCTLDGEGRVEGRTDGLRPCEPVL